MTTTGTVSTGTPAFNTGTFPVSITVPASCSFTQQPGDIVFNYTSFSPTVVLSNTSFQATCTNLLSYTIALDTTAGMVTGLNYTLALNTAASSGGSVPVASTGNGVPGRPRILHGYLYRKLYKRDILLKHASLMMRIQT